MTMDYSNYNVYEDPEFNDFLLQKPHLTETSIHAYEVALRRFVKFTQEPFYKTVHELRSLQNDRIENNIIIRFNPNQSKVKMLQYSFIDELRNQNVSTSTIESYIINLRSILRVCGVILPAPPTINKLSLY